VRGPSAYPHQTAHSARQSMPAAITPRPCSQPQGRGASRPAAARTMRPIAAQPWGDLTIPEVVVRSGFIRAATQVAGWGRVKEARSAPVAAGMAAPFSATRPPGSMPAAPGAGRSVILIPGSNPDRAPGRAQLQSPRECGMPGFEGTAAKRRHVSCPGVKSSSRTARAAFLGQSAPLAHLASGDGG